MPTAASAATSGRGSPFHSLGITMGYAIVYLLWFFCLFRPAIKIYKSTKVSGWKKTQWVIGCALSGFIPGLITAVIFALLDALNVRTQTAETLLFGPEASLILVATLLGFILPAAVSHVFFRRHRDLPEIPSVIPETKQKCTQCGQLSSKQVSRCPWCYQQFSPSAPSVENTNA